MREVTFERSHIRDFLKIYGIDFVLLQEMKTIFPFISLLRWIGGSFISGWSNLNSLKTLGGSLLDDGKLFMTVLANWWGDFYSQLN